MVLLLQPLSLSVVLEIDAVVLCLLQVCIRAVVSMLGDCRHVLGLIVTLVVFLYVLLVVSALCVLSLWYLQPIFVVSHVFSQVFVHDACLLSCFCYHLASRCGHFIAAFVIFFVSVMLLSSLSAR